MFVIINQQLKNLFLIKNIIKNVAFKYELKTIHYIYF